MQLTHMLKVFWARRAVILGVFLTLVALVLVAELLTPKAYVAEVSLLVNTKSADLLSTSQQAPQLDSGFLATQIDVIASHNVAAKVVDTLGLVDRPEVRRRLGVKADQQGEVRDLLADKLLEKLAVKPSRESSVINVNFTSSDPQTAAEIANAFAAAYIDTSLELKMEPARHQAGWFDEQLLDLRKKWQAAQERLSSYEQQTQVVGNDGELDIENAQLADIAKQLVAAQSAMYEAQARRRQIDNKQLGQLPDVQSNGLLQSMKADLARAESKLAEVAKRYGRNHPQYLGAEAEVDSLRQRLDREFGTANGSIIQSSQIAQQRATELEQALAAQKNKILALKQQHDALDVLTREVQGAQRTYEAATQRASEVRLESQLNQSSIAILNPAIAPLRPASPKLLLSLVMAALFGVLLGLGSALGVEVFDRRVRSQKDIAEMTGIPVLAELALFKPVPRSMRVVRPDYVSVTNRLALDRI